MRHDSLGPSAETRGLGDHLSQCRAHDLAGSVARNGLQDQAAKGTQLLVCKGLLEAGEELTLVVPHTRSGDITLLDAFPMDERADPDIADVRVPHHERLEIVRPNLRSADVEEL